MSRTVFPVVLALVAGSFAEPGFAQRPPAVTSPEVAPNGTVTWRLYAPKSSEVHLTGDWMGPGSKPIELTKDEAGVWTATAGPFEPNVYTYAYQVDGVSVPIDPSARRALSQAGRGASSAFEIPAIPARPWTSRDVPHGVVHQHPFRSTLQGQDRPYHVYTPPDYEQKPRKRYPVLVLLPGTPGNEADWVSIGFANRILDNLLADRLIQPMVVLMPRADVMVRVGTRADNFGEFEPLLLREILPDFERRYRVDAKTESRAIAGYSLGGELALSVGLRHPDVFRWVAGIDSSLQQQDFEPRLGPQLAAPAAFRSFRLIWLGCGAGDFLLPGNQKLDEMLTERHVLHTLRVIPGFHTMPTFRTLLVDLLPLLFRS